MAAISNQRQQALQAQTKVVAPNEQLTNTRFRGVRQDSLGSEVPVRAGLAVDSRGEVSTLLTHAAALIVAIDVQGLSLQIHVGVIVTP